MTYLHACVLGMIQGLSEFLPISSSAHLTLAPWLLGWPDPGLTFDVALHVGTLLSIVVYFFKDWTAILTGAAHQPTGPQGRLLFMLAAASVPAGLFGLAFEKAAEQSFRSPVVIGFLLIGFGLVLGAADRFGRRARGLEEFTWAGAMIVGAAQALALMPGVSRSGVTLSAGLALGLTRESAARFSFLLATPVIAGAALFKLRHLHGADLTGPFLAGVTVSALSGLAAVHFFLSRISRAGVGSYVIYRVVAGTAVMLLALSR